jgi:hypothetical protein
MADETIALQIFIEADKANLSLGELEKGFKAISEELKNTEKGTERFDELSTAIVQTTKEVKNLEASFKGLDNQQLKDEFTTLAGGIADVTAAIILMGGESETIDELAGSIKTAMAVSMGFKGAIDSVSSGMAIYNDLAKSGKIATIAKSAAEKTSAAGTWLLATAQTALNAIMSANPIALIVLAVAALVTAFISLGGSIMGLIDTALQPFQFAIDKVVDALQWMGIMESDSAIATRKAEKEKSDAAIKSAEKRVAATDKLIKAHKKATDMMVSDMDWEIRKRRANGEDTTEIEIEKLENLIIAAKEEQKLQQRRRQDLMAEVKLRLKTGQLSAKIVLETLASLKESAEAEILARDNQLQGERELEIALIKLKKEARDKSAEISREALQEQEKNNAKEIEDQEKKIAKEIALEKDKIKLLDDLEAKAFEDKNLRAVAEKELAHTREKEALILKHGEDAELLAALDAAQLVEMNALDDSIEQEAIAKEAERVAAAKAIKDEALAAEKAAEEKAAEEKAARRDKDFADATAVIGALSALNSAATDTALLNAAGDEEKKEKIRKASFEREKKLNIAMAAINGAQAVLAGFAQGGLPMAIVAGVTAAAQLAAIIATTYQGGGSVKEVDNTAPVEPTGPDAGGGAQINAVTNTSTILGNQQVYVTETDITSTQNNVSVIEESATF